MHFVSCPAPVHIFSPDRAARNIGRTRSDRRKCRRPTKAVACRPHWRIWPALEIPSANRASARCVRYRRINPSGPKALRVPPPGQGQGAQFVIVAQRVGQRVGRDRGRGLRRRWLPVQINTDAARQQQGGRGERPTHDSPARSRWLLGKSGCRPRPPVSFASHLGVRNSISRSVR